MLWFLQLLTQIAQVLLVLFPGAALYMKPIVFGAERSDLLYCFRD